MPGVGPPRPPQSDTPEVNLQVFLHPGTGGGLEDSRPGPHSAGALSPAESVQDSLAGPVQAVPQGPRGARGGGGGGGGADVGGQTAVVGSDDLNDLGAVTGESHQLPVTAVLSLQVPPP